MGLHVFEIFESISGEVGGFPQGARAVFLRLGGCNLRCPYCDTKATWTRDNSHKMTIGAIIKKIDAFDINNIVITGGEPLLQAHDVTYFCKCYAGTGKQISIETNGTLQIPEAILNMAHVTIVADFKLEEHPASYLGKEWGHARPYRIEKVFGSLRETDYIKFVVNSVGDIKTATLIQLNMDTHANFAYSPMITNADQGAMDILQMQNQLSIKASLILERLRELRLNATLNVQLHKILNLP